MAADFEPVELRRTSHRLSLVAIGLSAIAIGALLPAAGYVLHQQNQNDLKAAQAQVEVANVKADIATFRANQALDAQRARNRTIVSTCNQDNARDAAAVRERFRHDLILAAALAPEPRDQATQDAVNAFIAADIAAARQEHPHRDCSPHALGIVPIASPLPQSGTGASAAASPPPAPAGAPVSPTTTAISARTRETTSVPPSTTAACCPPTTVCVHPPPKKCRPNTLHP